MTTHASGQWPAVAKNFLSLIKHPLRPVAEDIAFLNQKTKQWFSMNKIPPSVLILGVTPEYFHAQWPEGARIFALDQTPEMIEYVWPGNKQQAILGSWLDATLPRAQFDIVLCDGGLHLLDYPETQSQLAKRLSTLIAPNGFFLTRLFLAPKPAESEQQVLDNLKTGKIPSLNHLKISLGTAIQKNPRQGTLLADVWESINRLETDQTVLAEQLNWKLEELQLINAYKNNQARYYFSDLEQISACFSCFNKPEIHQPTYFMGAQFPTLIFNQHSG